MKISHAGIYCWAFRYLFLVIAPQLLHLSDFNSIYAYGIPMQPLICAILKVPFDLSQELFICAFNLLSPHFMRVNYLKYEKTT